MNATRKRLLLLIGVVGALCGITASRIHLALTSVLLVIRATTPLALSVMFAALLWWTILVRRRLVHLARARHEAQHPGTLFRMREKPLHPIVAARTVALAFASSRAGSYVCGFYLGVAATYLGHFDVVDVRWYLVLDVLSVIMSAALVAVALWLERSCQLPGPPAPSTADPLASA